MEEKYLVEAVEHSELEMEIQGLGLIASGGSEAAEERGTKATDKIMEERFEYKGFHRNKCYHFKIPRSGKDVVVGIHGFYKSEKAECVLIIPFSKTFLGENIEGVKYEVRGRPSKYFQVRLPTSIRALPLEHFGLTRSEFRSGRASPKRKDLVSTLHSTRRASAIAWDCEKSLL